MMNVWGEALVIRNRVQQRIRCEENVLVRKARAVVSVYEYCVLSTPRNLYAFFVPSHSPFNKSNIAPTPRMKFAKQTRNAT